MAKYKRRESPSSSSRDRTLVKRRMKQEHGGNFRVGYVPVDEERLHMAGIRGRKACAFCAIITLLTAVVIANLVLTLLIIVTLRINRDGMEALEFSHGGEVLWFLEDTEAEQVTLYLGSVGTLEHGSLELTAAGGQKVIIQAGMDNTTADRLVLADDSITLISDNGFSVLDAETGEAIFTSPYADKLHIPESTQHLKVNKLQSTRITSGVDDDLRLEAAQTATLAGWESLSIESSEVLMSAQSDLSFTADQLSLNSSGCYIKQLGRLKLTSSPSKPVVESYTVCVCLSGRLFLLPAAQHCYDAHPDNDPCVR